MCNFFYTSGFFYKIILFYSYIWFSTVFALQINTTISFRDGKIDLSSIKEAYEIFKEHDLSSVFMDQIYDQTMSSVKILCTQSAEDPSNCEQKAQKEMNEIIGVKKTLKRSSKYKYRAFNEHLLRSKCESDCMKLNIFPGITRTQKEYKKVYEEIKNKSKICQERVLQNLIDELDKQRIPKECLTSNNENCEQVVKKLNSLRWRVLDLAKLVYGQENLIKWKKETEARSLCVDCEGPEDNTNKSVLDSTKKLIELIRTSQCQDILPGEKKLVVSGTEEKMNPSYTLHKEEDGSYSVLLALDFFAHSSYSGEVSSEEVPSYYMKKVQSCLKDANSKFFGPKGEKVKILVSPVSYGSKDQDCDPILTTVAIKGKDFRSNSVEYASDIACPAITHEILHLLGLPDEYPETARGYYVTPKQDKLKIII